MVYSTCLECSSATPLLGGGGEVLCNSHNANPDCLGIAWFGFLVSYLSCSIVCHVLGKTTGRAQIYKLKYSFTSDDDTARSGILTQQKSRLSRPVDVLWWLWEPIQPPSKSWVLTKGGGSFSELHTDHVTLEVLVLVLECQWQTWILSRGCCQRK